LKPIVTSRWRDFKLNKVNVADFRLSWLGIRIVFYEIASRQIHVLRQYQGNHERPIKLRQLDVRGDEGSG
jgi:hypothetical protein